jgi:hypothetical protein
MMLLVVAAAMVSGAAVDMSNVSNNPSKGQDMATTRAGPDTSGAE